MFDKEKKWKRRQTRELLYDINAVRNLAAVNRYALHENFSGSCCFVSTIQSKNCMLKAFMNIMTGLPRCNARVIT
jgi:hypothetical protein